MGNSLSCFIQICHIYLPDFYTICYYIILPSFLLFLFQMYCNAHSKVPH